MSPAAESTPPQKSRKASKRKAEQSAGATALPKQKRTRPDDEAEDTIDEEYGFNAGNLTLVLDSEEQPQVYEMSGPKEFYSIGTLDEGKLSSPLYNFEALRKLFVSLETHDVVVVLPVQPEGEVTGSVVRAVEATFQSTKAVAERQQFGVGYRWSVPKAESLWEKKAKLTQTLWVEDRPFIACHFPRSTVLPHAERDSITPSVYWSFSIPANQPDLPKAVLAEVYGSGRISYAEVWRGYTAEGKETADWFLRVYQPSSKLLKKFKEDDFTLKVSENLSVTLKAQRRCIFCLRVDMHGNRHPSKECGVLKKLNGVLDGQGLTEVEITSKLKISWVDAPKAYDVQKSLKTLLLQTQIQNQQLSALEQRVTSLEAENLALRVQSEGGKGKEGKKGKGKAEEKVSAPVPIQKPTPGSSKEGSKKKYYSNKK